VGLVVDVNNRGLHDVAANGTVTPYGTHEANLTRNQCTYVNGASPTLTGTSVLSYNVPTALVAVVAGKSCSTSCVSAAGAGAAGWASASGVSNISFVIDEAATNSADFSTDPTCTANATYCYTVAAAPRTWEQIDGGGTPVTPVSGMVPAEFIGTASGDLASCTSANPNLDVNGEVVIDSTTGPSSSGKQNVYPGSVSYVGSAGPPSDVAGSPPMTAISQPLPDLLGNLPSPNMSGLPTNPATQKIGSITYAYPGIYTIQLSGTLTLVSGVYELEKGIGGNITSGVGGDLLYVTGGSVAPTGMNVWPLTTGTYAGISIWQGPAVDSGQGYDTNTLDSGPGPTQIDGIVYAPGATFDWHGSASIWVGAILTQGLSCAGGGNGELNVGYEQTITFHSSAPASATVGSHYTVSATGGASGNPVTFSIDNLSTAGACSISGSTVTFTKAGTCLVDANQAQSDQTNNPEAGGYIEAPTVQQSIAVG
jgi:hypothetical protein